MPYLELHELRKAYGGTIALNELNLEVEEGELFTLLGPSGCGKSTTLRCVAGLELPDKGEIALGGKILFSHSKGVFVPPQKRGMGFVPQSYATWPHMTVLENVEFGLKVRKVPKKERRERAMRTLRMVGLEGLEKRYPTQLSGGQQQRVALARALVVEPEVLLLDEPLSNLDAVLRQAMRAEIRALQRRLGITVLYVTHDQVEAMALSDRMAVMKEGRIMQIGKPAEIYEEPADAFVAGFIGEINLFPCKLLEVKGNKALVEALGTVMECNVPSGAGDSCFLAIRPERVDVKEASASEGVLAELIDVRYMGNYVEYLVDVGGHKLRVQTKPRQVLKKGLTVRLVINEAVLIRG